MMLITGGNGVIGTRLAKTLRAKNQSVRVMGLPNPIFDGALRAAGVEVFHGDVTRDGDLRVATAGVHTVFHLAALLSSPENPDRFHTINVEGTRNALRAAEQASVGHFIFISSISVTYPRRNAYSASKAEAEHWVRQSPLPWTVARPCLVLDGLGGGAEYRAFADAVRAVRSRNGRRWYFPGGGKARKRPIHAEDLAEGLANLAGNPRCFGKTYALGGAEIVSLREMAEAILAQAGQSKYCVSLPAWPLRVLAWGSECASRWAGRRLSWISRQSLDGLVFDAAPDIAPACRDLAWTPRGFKEILKGEVLRNPPA